MIGLGIVAVLLLALGWPIQFCISGRIAERSDWEGRIWLWAGLLRTEAVPNGWAVRFLGIAIYRRSWFADSTKKRKTTRPKKKKTKAPSSVFVWTSWRQYLSLIRRVKQALHLRVSARLTIGLDDPADTGLLVGGLLALSSALGWGGLTVQSDYQNTVFHCRVRLKGRIYPLEALWVAIWAIRVLAAQTKKKGRTKADGHS